VAWWEERGYRVKLSDRVRLGRQGYGGEEAAERGEEITRMFADPEVDAIQCYEAGYGAPRILPHIDFQAVRENPKPFVGFSDITTLHLALRSRADLVTLYGPLFVTMGRPDTGFSTDRLLAALTSAEPLGEVPRDPDRPDVLTWGSGRASGELVGGCLWPIMQSIGTPWQPDLAGRILLFEDVAKAPYLVDEALAQLRHAGMLEGVAGVVVGEMAACDWRTVPEAWPKLMSLEDVLREHLEPLGVPVIYGLPVGHGTHLATVPLGVLATVDADRGTLTIDDPALVDRGGAPGAG
jgi:muramoyltetrapeptide carboxypeptidase